MWTPVVDGGIGRARSKAPGGELVAPLSFDDDDSGGVTGMLYEMVQSEPSEYRNVNWGTSALVRASSSSSCGLVANAKKKAADFRGHEGNWLNEKELKDALGRKPGFQERPSVLNALAYTCGDSSCPSKQCSSVLDEVNLTQLRGSWFVECKSNGYESGDAKGPVMDVLVRHCTSQTEKPTSFEKVSVQITDRRGELVKVELCVKTWAIAVAGMGKSTFDKMRADVPREIESRRNGVALLQCSAAAADSTLSSVTVYVGP